MVMPQLSSINPGGQMQVKSTPSSMHVPLFRQRLGEQLSTSGVQTLSSVHSHT